MEAFEIFDVCEDLPGNVKVITTRWETFRRATSGDAEAREFRHDDPEMEGLYTSGSTAATGRLVDMHAVQHGYSILCFDAENAYFHVEEDEEVYCWSLRERVKRYHARGGRVESSRWKLKRQLSGRRKAANKFNEFVVTASDGLGIEQCPEQDDQEPH